MVTDHTEYSCQGEDLAEQDHEAELDYKLHVVGHDVNWLFVAAEVS
jgi:hypothetical protein